MKKYIISLALGLLLASGLKSFAVQTYPVDTTTLQPGITHLGLYWMTATNGAASVTNAPVWLYSTNTPTGDLLPVAFGKLQTNILAAREYTLTNSYRLYSPSNYWNQFNVTNGMNAGDIKTVNSNGLALVSVWISNGVPVINQLIPAATGGSSYPDITDDGLGNVGINQTGPAYPLDIGGNMEIGATLAGFGNYLQIDDGAGNMFVNTANALNTGPINVTAGANIIQLNTSGLSMNSALFFLSGSAISAGDSTDFGTDGSVSLASGAMQVDTSGNVTCLSLSQTSDVNTKTNIAPLALAGMLDRITATPVYTWNFRDRTVVHTNLVHRPVYGTNMVTGTNGIAHIHRAIIGTNTITTLSTNTLHGGMTHIGPMAQDWSANFGGKTNAISIIDMQGILLAGEQALADPSRIQVTPFVKLTPYTVTHSTNSTFGYGAGLLAVDGDSLFVSTGTNTWRRINLGTNAW